MGQKQEKKKKKKIRFKGLLIVILFLYLALNGLYYLWNSPVKRINFEGNTYLKENYLIDYLDIEDKSLLKIKKKDIKNKLLKLELISDVSVHKNYFGSINIIIEEEKVLFYNWNTKKIVLSDGEEIEFNKEFLGIPTLINYVPDEIYQKLVKRISLVDKDILSLVSEIEYSPSKVGDKIVDETRFIFRMNDGNQVYINTINIEKINDYLETYEAIVNKKGDIKGCLYLDSNSDNNHFSSCESKVVEEENEDGEN